jgi:hypothetical protein
VQLDEAYAERDEMLKWVLDLDAWMGLYGVPECIQVIRAHESGALTPTPARKANVETANWPMVSRLNLRDGRCFCVALGTAKLTPDGRRVRFQDAATTKRLRVRVEAIEEITDDGDGWTTWNRVLSELTLTAEDRWMLEGGNLREYGIPQVESPAPRQVGHKNCGHADTHKNCGHADTRWQNSKCAASGARNHPAAARQRQKRKGMGMTWEPRSA